MALGKAVSSLIGTDVTAYLATIEAHWIAHVPPIYADRSAAIEPGK